jgi:hypothetical protein
MFTYLDDDSAWIDFKDFFTIKPSDQMYGLRDKSFPPEAMYRIGAGARQLCERASCVGEPTVWESREMLCPVSGFIASFS